MHPSSRESRWREPAACPTNRFVFERHPGELRSSWCSRTPARVRCWWTSGPPGPGRPCARASCCGASPPSLRGALPAGQPGHRPGEGDRRALRRQGAALLQACSATAGWWRRSTACRPRPTTAPSSNATCLPLADRAQAAALAALGARAIRTRPSRSWPRRPWPSPSSPSCPLLLAKLLIRQGRHADAHAVLAALPRGAAPGAPEIAPPLHPPGVPDGRPERRAPGVRDPGRRPGRQDPDRLKPPASPWPPAPLVVQTTTPTGPRRTSPSWTAAPRATATASPGEACSLVLELLGPDDEQVRRYRRSLFEH